MNFYKKLIIIGIIGVVPMAIIFGIIIPWIAYAAMSLKIEMPEYGTIEYLIFMHVMWTTDDEDLYVFLRLIWLLS